MKQKIAIIFVFAMLIFSACKTTRTLTKSTPVITNALSQEIEQVQKMQPHFNTANINKLSMAFNLKERKLNVSATCKIKKDSVIYLSIQPFLGIEMFKAELTVDSMRVFDKMNHKFYVVGYNYFSKMFGVNVDFYSLQSLLTAQFFCVGKREIQIDSCKLTALDAGKSKIDFENNNMLQSTEISSLKTIDNVILNAKNSNYKLETKYSDFTVIDGVNFPQTISLQASNQNSNATCDFSILRVEFNKDLKFYPTNAERFTRGDLDQLLKK
ncbi:MAG: DUF4292 domain-containing protein [Paludibacter sp.]|nr:DUF4292 domain-containing protein [Paludibacter sp.]